MSRRQFLAAAGLGAAASALWLTTTSQVSNQLVFCVMATPCIPRVLQQGTCGQCSALWQGHQRSLPSKFILELDLEDTMLVENAQPMAVVEVGLVKSCKPLAEILDRFMEQVKLARLAPQLRPTIVTS